MNRVLEYKLLREQVANDDAFEYKTHDRIAESILKLLENEDESITIGLEGPWGSGKSTVISLLEQKLSLKGTTKLIRFDSWAHEGDPLRRIFLESVIEELKDEDESLNSELLSIGDKITNRKKKIKIRSSQSITGLGKLLAVATFLVPPGIAMMTKVTNVSLSLNMSDAIHWPAFISSLMIAAPLLLLFGNIPYLLFYKKVSLRELFQTENWVFLQQQSSQKIKQKITEENERSSIEFEKYFEEILKTFFDKQDKFSKLVIVVDNLDRVDAKDALKILSTLQTFLQQRNHSNKTNNILKKVWIIIPFDYEGLKSLWSSGETTDNFSSKNDSVSKSFLDKNFQIRLEVPKPIFSNWLEFTNSMIKAALPNWDLESKADIANILRLSRRDLNDIPTPREIKNYINQVAIIANYTQSSVPISSICYYAILRLLENKSVSEVREQLIKGLIPIPNHSSFLPTTIRKDLSGLIFGVSSKVGFQILLEPEIESTLKSGDSSKFQELKKQQGKEFWLVFIHHLKSKSATEDIDIIYKYASALDGSFEDTNHTEHKLFIDFIKSIIRKDNFKFSYPINLQQSFLSLLNLCITDGDVSNTLYSKLINSFSTYIGTQDNLDEKDLGFFDEVTKSCKSNGVPIRRYKFKNLTITHLIDLNKYCEDNNADLWDWILPDDEILEVISAQINPGSTFSGLNSAVRYSRKANTINNWSPLITVLNNYIRYNQGSNPTHSDEAIEILLDIAISKAPSSNIDEIKTIVSSGEFMNWCHYKLNTSKINIILLTGYILKSELFTINIPHISYANNAIAQIRTLWQTTDKELAHEIIIFLESSDGNHVSRMLYNFIWELAKDEDRSLAHDIINQASSRNIHSPLFRSKNCVAALKTPNVDSNNLAKALIVNNDIEKQLQGLTLDDIIENSKELYYLLKTSKNIDIASALAPLIQIISADRWNDEFENDSFLLSLIIEIKELNNSFKLDHKYADAIILFTTKSETSTQWQKDSWEELVSILDDHYVEDYRNKITNHFISSGALVLEEFLDLAPAYINVDDVLKHGSLIESIIADILQQKKISKLAKVHKIISTSSKFSEYVPHANKIKIIKERIDSLLSEEYTEEEKSILIQISKLFNIKLKKINKPK